MPAPDPAAGHITDVRTHARQPAGIPVGGQFAAGVHEENPLDLAGPAEDPDAVDRDLIQLSPACSQVLEAIRQAAGRPLIVGGSVRDALMARDTGDAIAPKDIDIEVYGARPEDLLRELSAVGWASEVGMAFGVIKATVDGEDFDVSLPRRDSRTGDGHRGFDVEVDHGMTPAEASARRDFTVNSMGWDPATGEIVDPHGGLDDLHAGVLRHTSDAFDEDPLRALRGVQFAGRFGFELAPETIERCRGLSERFGELSTERVAQEWRKIAARADRPSASLAALHAIGWERHFPELAAIRDVPQDAHWHPEGSVSEHTAQAADAAAAIAKRDGLSETDREVLVLAAMLHDTGKATHTQIHDDGRITSHGHDVAGDHASRSFLARIGIPARIADQVGPIVREHMVTASIGKREPNATDVRRLIRRLDDNGKGATIEQWARVCEADRGGRGEASGPTEAWKWVQIARTLPADRPVLKPILTGDHLIAAGMRPGPQFRPILDAAIDAQDAGKITDDDTARRWLAGRLGA